MAVSLGGVKVEFDGDASGAAAAMQQVADKLDDLVKKENNLRAALDAATKAGNVSGQALGALRSEHAKAAEAVSRLTSTIEDNGKAAEDAAKKTSAAATAHTTLRDRAKGVDEKMGKLQVTIGGVSQAIGHQNQAVANAVGGIADLAMAFGAGGPWVAAAAVAVASIGYIAEKLDLLGTKAKENAKKVRQAIDDDMKAIYDLRLADDAAAKGVSVEREKQQRARDQAKQRADTAERSMQEVASKGSSATQKEIERVTKEYNEATRKLASAEARLAAIVETEGNAAKRSAEEKEKEAKKAAADKRREERLAAEKRLADALAREAEELEQRKVAQAYKRLIDNLDKLRAGDMSAMFETSDVLDVPSGRQQVTSAQFEDIIKKMLEATPMSTEEIEQMNDAFISADDAIEGMKDGVIDLRSPMERLKDSFKEGAKTFEEGIKGVGGASGLAATTIQSGFGASGQALGGIAGGATALALGAPPEVGSAIGSVLGGLLGSSLDKLIEALGVLTPLFDAIGIIIGALQPVLVILGALFASVADALVGLAPIILIVARVVGAILLPFVRLSQLLLLLIPIVSLAASFILVWADYLSIAIGWLDEKVFKPILSAASYFVNGLIYGYNTIITLIRNIPGMGDFGTLADPVDFGESTTQYNGIDDMINDVSEAMDLVADNERADQGAGGAGDGAGQSGWETDMANVPSGFKAAASIYASAEGQLVAPPWLREAMGGITINIENWNSRREMSRDVEDLRKTARNGSKVRKASSSRQVGDDKN